MKIKLILDLQVDPKYEMKKGRILEVVDERQRSETFRWLVRGDRDMDFGVFEHEAVEVKEDEAK